MTQRTIILHYHLFKNAGTSVDRILKDNFADQWVTREFAGVSNTRAIEDWIRETPDAVAFSSHTMMGPLPQVPGVKIISIMLLRDPIARIRSAYRFERRQVSDGFGAVLAKYTDLEGYVRVRLSLPNDRQCRDFQTWRLASLVPGDAPEVTRARQAMQRLSLVGQVEDFGGFVTALQAKLAPDFPQFQPNIETRANVSHPSAEAAPDSPELMRLLAEANDGDLQLLQSFAA